MRKFEFYVYILKCIDQSYYIGVTNNIERRISEHSNSTYSNYTSSRLPIELVHLEIFNDIRIAIAREKQLKKWSRKKKEALIKGNYDLLHTFSECANESKSKPLTEFKVKNVGLF